MRFVFLPGLDGTGLLFEPVVQLWPAEQPAPIILSYPPDRFLDYNALEAYVQPKLPGAEPYILPPGPHPFREIAGVSGTGQIHQCVPTAVLNGSKGCDP